MEIVPKTTAYNSSLFGSGMSSNAISQTERTNFSGFDNSWTNMQNQILLNAQLKEIEVECSEKGWDGYSARPIGSLALFHAKHIINSIPYNIKRPEITPQADGEISFAWYRSPYHQIMFTIGSSGKIHYAGLLGDRSFSGSKRLSQLGSLLNEARSNYRI